MSEYQIEWKEVRKLLYDHWAAYDDCNMQAEAQAMMDAISSFERRWPPKEQHRNDDAE